MTKLHNEHIALRGDTFCTLKNVSEQDFRSFLDGLEARGISERVITLRKLDSTSSFDRHYQLQFCFQLLSCNWEALPFSLVLCQDERTLFERVASRCGWSVA